MWLVDIDTGGTMTDVVVSGARDLRHFKVETTPHDFTVCFREGLAFAASALQYESTAQFLGHVTQIRWSSTITTNVLAELKGSKVGLLVSSGFEDTLYGQGASPIVDRLVAKAHIVGMRCDAQPGELVATVRRMLEDGARRICVSYKNQYPDHASEKRAKEIIQEQYPDQYLGAVPVLLGSEMAQTVHDTTRTHYSVINAYVHSQLAASLFNAEDVLRTEFNWTGPLLVGHTNGGVARLGKTKAVDTIESGPVFGTFGAAYFARHYRRDAVVALDVGGTTTKASGIRSGSPVYVSSGDLLGIPVRARLPLLKSAAVGGGSIVRRLGPDKVELGPESMGAAPGPACYGLGGENATLTDALLCLGYLDPDKFLGGRRALDRALAREALVTCSKQHTEAIEILAEAVRDKAVERMSELICGIIEAAEFTRADVSLFAFGGNGPMFAALVCEKIGINECWIFALAPVLGAFGSAISRVVHVYERGIVEPHVGQPYANAASLAIMIMLEQAALELRAEGLDPGKAIFEVECKIAESGGVEGSISVGDISLAEGAEEIERKIDAAVRLRIPDPAAGRRIVTAIVTASYVVPAYHPETHAKLGKTKKKVAPSGTRDLYFSGTWLKASVFDWERLATGQIVQGPSIATSDVLTCLVPPGWRLEVDGYRNGRLARNL